MVGERLDELVGELRKDKRVHIFRLMWAGSYADTDCAEGFVGDHYFFHVVGLNDEKCLLDLLTNDHFVVVGLADV